MLFMEMIAFIVSWKTNASSIRTLNLNRAYSEKKMKLKLTENCLIDN